MATITKISRPSGVRYKAIIRAKGVTLKTKTFTKKANAVDWVKRIEGDREAMAALGLPGASLSVADLVRDYEDAWQGKDKSTLPRVRWWGKRFGNMKLTAVTGDDIQKALDDYAAGKAQRGNGLDEHGKPKIATIDRPRSPSSVNRLKAAGSSLFRFAIKKRHLRTNPFTGVAGETENNKRKRYLTDDERPRLLLACQASQWDKLHLLVLLALGTGARRGELLKLRWSDINFIERTALLHDTKNGSPRLLTLPPPCISELQKFLPRSNVVPLQGDKPAERGYVFQSKRYKNRPTCPHAYWKQALNKAGIEDLRFHDLRHSAASYLAMAGATLLEIGEVLGHKSQQTTLRYAHLSTDHKRKLTDRVLGGIPEGGSG